jgi:stearoyl-CoA desaturase (delta-9 desaturase)
MACQGSVIWWAGVHRTHHQFPDRPGDPHSPLDGFYEAHMGWLFGHKVNPSDWTRRVRDLLRDPVAKSVHRWYPVCAVCGFIGPAVLVAMIQGSWYGLVSGFLWGGLVRVFLVTQIVASVNSICHSFGQRPYRTHDMSRNNYALMLPSLGFSLHNNHHAFPSAATTSHAWWQIDICGFVIQTMAACGLVWDVNLPSGDQLARRANCAGGSEIEPPHRVAFVEYEIPVT